MRSSLSSDANNKLQIAQRTVSTVIPLLVMLFVAVVLWILWGATSRYWAVAAGAIAIDATQVPASTAAAGAWGDAFGGFNALVGALGTSAVAITLALQFRSSEVQKVDQHISRFEENFFRLIDLMRELRSHLVYSQTENFLRSGSMYASEGEHKSYSAIEAAYNEVSHWSYKFHSNLSAIREKIIAAQYDNYIHSRFEYCFSPYFRIIYTILNNIRQDVILNDVQKAYYGNILRSQLTSYEIGLLAFNSTSDYSKDLKELIVEFRLLKYLPRKRRKILGKIFSDLAYQARD